MKPWKYNLLFLQCTDLWIPVILHSCVLCTAVFQPALLSKFKDVTNSRRAEDVTTLVLAFLEVYNCLKRVTVMASGLKREHAKVKLKICLAVLILCYPHLNLNVAPNKRAARMRGCQIFFSHLARLSFPSGAQNPCNCLMTCQR